MDGVWWSSRLGLSLIWLAVVQGIADFSGDLLPWLVAIAIALLAGFLGTYVVVFGWHAAIGSDS